MTEQEIYKSAIQKYGANHQETKAIEEMSELIKEICKNKDGEDNIEQIAEEIADVTIMLEQMKILFDCDSAVCFYIDEKLQRLQKRMENEVKPKVKKDSKNMFAWNETIQKLNGE